MQVENNVVFGTGGGRDLHCDVYRPNQPNGVGLLLLHAGSWRRGSKDTMEPQANILTENGYTCVASEYRLLDEATWPAQIHDAKAALRWMRANASNLDVETDRIGVLGNSAGAHMSLLLAGTPNLPEFDGEGGNANAAMHVAICVAFYPPTSFFTGNERVSGGVPAQMLLEDGVNAEAARAASPITYASPDFPPTFMLHGTADELVPCTSSLRMYEALAKHRTLVELHMQAGIPHAYANRQPEIIHAAMAEVVVFLNRHMTSLS